MEIVEENELMNLMVMLSMVFFVFGFYIGWSMAVSDKSTKKPELPKDTK